MYYTSTVVGSNDSSEVSNVLIPYSRGFFFPTPFVHVFVLCVERLTGIRAVLSRTFSFLVEFQKTQMYVE